MTKILTETLTVLTAWLGVNETAQKESENNFRQLKILLSSGYRIKLATSSSIQNILFVSYVLEKEEYQKE